jgi:hypothetical protein
VKEVVVVVPVVEVVVVVDVVVLLVVVPLVVVVVVVVVVPVLVVVSRGGCEGGSIGDGEKLGPEKAGFGGRWTGLEEDGEEGRRPRPPEVGMGARGIGSEACKQASKQASKQAQGDERVGG